MSQSHLRCPSNLLIKASSVDGERPMPVESESPQFPQTPAQGLLSLSECIPIESRTCLAKSPILQLLLLECGGSHQPETRSQSFFATCRYCQKMKQKVSDVQMGRNFHIARDKDLTVSNGPRVKSFQHCLSEKHHWDVTGHKSSGQWKGASVSG